MNKEQEAQSSATAPPLPFLKCDGKPVYFDEDWDTGIGGGLWSTGLAMAKYFQHNSSSIQQSLTAIQRLMGETDGISALELGSGNGFLSICLAAIASDILEDLVITDMEDHLALIEKTVFANSHIIIAEELPHNDNKQIWSDSGGRIDDNTSATTNAANDNSFYKNNEGYRGKKRIRCCVMEHRWGEFQCAEAAAISNNNNSVCGKIPNLKQQVQDGTKKFDFIFGSDVAYRNHLHSPLIASLDKFSHEHTISLIGVTMSDTKPAFFKSLVEAGFRYDRIADHLMSPEFRGTTFGLFVIRRADAGI